MCGVKFVFEGIKIEISIYYTMDSDSDFEVEVRKQGKKQLTSVNTAVLPAATSLVRNDPRRVYLITYAHADKKVFPTRESFGKACENAFGGGKRVSFYSCSEETHEDGTPHYHVSFKLTKPQRWANAKQKLSEMGAVVNFAQPQDNVDCMYAWAYRYATKTDRHAYHSPAHPSLERIQLNWEKTRAASSSQNAKKNSAQSSQSTSTNKSPPPKRRKGLTNEDVGDYCREKNIRTVDELLADAEIRKRNGDKTLSSYVYSRSVKTLGELIDMAWRMARAVAKVSNLARPRLESLRTALSEECIPECQGLWLRCALDLLARNNINRYVYADAMRAALEKGRGKDRNIYLVGPGNTGKTFLLKPMLKIYPEAFSNPASSHFSWIGAEEATLILLNDYRWHTKKNGGNIEWGSLLNLLEGFETNLPAPMNWYSRHIKITGDVPLFGTGPAPISWYANSPDEIRTKRHEEEDKQMAFRWKTFNFTHVFTDKDRIQDIPECSFCFASLIFLGQDHGM